MWVSISMVICGVDCLFNLMCVVGCKLFDDGWQVGVFFNVMLVIVLFVDIWVNWWVVCVFCLFSINWMLQLKGEDVEIWLFEVVDLLLIVQYIDEFVFEVVFEGVFEVVVWILFVYWFDDLVMVVFLFSVVFFQIFGLKVG